MDTVLEGLKQIIFPNPPLAVDVRVALSIMNFLEFAIWGAWFVVLGQYLNSLKFTGRQIGSIYSTMALGSIFSPIIAGTIADKFLPAQQMLGILHLMGAGLLLAMSRIKTAGKFYLVALAYALVYSPTIGLARGVMNAHSDPGLQGPSLRVWGTIGWIVANLALGLLLTKGQPVNNRPLILAAALSLIFGIYAFFLPHTPPAGASSLFPFMDALELVRNDPAVATFFGVSFFIAIALAFYYGFTSLFLEQQVKVRPENVGPLMTIGQWMEIIFMLLLPIFIEALGLKTVLLVGMGAWVLRYGLFAAGGPFPLILVGLGLHGICYDFFFEAGFINVASIAPKEFTQSAIALFVTLTYGLGMYLGNEASGWVHEFCTKTVVDPTTGVAVQVTNWRRFWTIPGIGALACFLVFLFLGAADKPKVAAPQEAPAAATLGAPSTTPEAPAVTPPAAGTPAEGTPVEAAPAAGTPAAPSSP